MKIFCPILISLMFLNVMGCNVSKNELLQKVKKYMFEDTKCFQIVKYDSNEAHSSIIEGNELKEIQSELENSIEFVKKYKADAAPFGGFEYGYRALIITKNDDLELHAILYSIKENMIIIREKDIFPDSGYNLPEIIVYKFKIPKSVINVFVKHEKELPENGDFFTSFPR